MDLTRSWPSSLVDSCNEALNEEDFAIGMLSFGDLTAIRLRFDCDLNALPQACPLQLQLLPGTRYQLPATWSLRLVPSISLLVPTARYLVPGTRTWYQLLDTSSSLVPVPATNDLVRWEWPKSAPLDVHYVTEGRSNDCKIQYKSYWLQPFTKTEVCDLGDLNARTMRFGIFVIYISRVAAIWTITERFEGSVCTPSQWFSRFGLRDLNLRFESRDSALRVEPMLR